MAPRMCVDDMAEDAPCQQPRHCKSAHRDHDRRWSNRSGRTMLAKRAWGGSLHRSSGAMGQNWALVSQDLRSE